MTALVIHPARWSDEHLNADTIAKWHHSQRADVEREIARMRLPLRPRGAA